MPEHDAIPIGEIHKPHNWEYADATTREAATGFIAGDVGKQALQLDDHSRWTLTDDAPPTWSSDAAGPHVTAHENGGDDELDVTGLSGVLADPQIAGSILETGDPQLLTVGAVADGQFLKRAGTDIVGAAPGGGSGLGDVVGPGSSTDNAVARFDSTTGKLIQNSTVTVSDTGAIKGPTQIEDSNGNEVVKYGSTASAVNEVTITNKATGNAPTVEATGGDTDIDLNLVSKGAGVVKANGSALAFRNAEINAQTGTTYTLVATDNGKIVTCSNGSAITVTVPSGLGTGFNCLVIQIGAGQVTFSPSSTTINNRQSHTKIAGQYGIATLAAYASNVFALGGDTTT